MRFASLLGGLMMLLEGVALGAEGDTLTVSGDGVNVRARPETGAPILRQVNHGELAIELLRQGEWVQVRLPDRDTTGWIHGSLVTTEGGQPAAAVPTPAAPSRPAPATATPAVRAQPGSGGGLAQPGGPKTAAVGDARTIDAVARFRESVTELNDRAVAAAGVDLFTDVAAVGDGAVQVTATDAWNVVPEGGKQSFMNTLFGRWLEAVGSGQPLRVEVVDKAGQVLREQSGP
jgi:hypothetical protein